MSRLFLLLLVCLPLIVGCDGCRQQVDPKKAEEERKEAAKEEFTGTPPYPFPADRILATSALKPGHWTTARQAIKSNKTNARGDLTSHVAIRNGDFSNGANVSSMLTQRPAVLPKGRNRRLNFRVLPPMPTGSTKSLSLFTHFASAGQGIFFDPASQPFRIMEPEEYFMVLLTSRPNRFSKWKNADWVRPFREKYDEPTYRKNYRIVIPADSGVITIPDTMLDWTNTAVLVFDNLAPEALTPDQQTAMDDWVHFGGRLIINGPLGASSMSQTKLSTLMPLDPTGNIELDPDSAAVLLNRWSIPKDRSLKKQIAILRGNTSRVAMDGIVSDDVTTLHGSGGLVLVKQVGRGNVVQTRMDLTSDWISNWESYNSFINGVILGRPSRKYSRTSDTGALRHDFVSKYPKSAEALLNTGLRIHCRDAVLDRSGNPIATGGDSKDAAILMKHQAYRAHAGSGVGGWHDDSETMRLFQRVLREQSGIEIPESSLVVRLLSIYLLILVPINYAVFRLFKKLKYAWMAVPVIAMGGAIWVANAARLDIGFARSQVELALLETQPGHGRGHLTRAVAIYNSLSTRYEANFSTMDSAAKPLGLSHTSTPPSLFKMSYKEGPTLSGMIVGSNQVRMLHAEQIVELGGSFSLADEQTLLNTTAMEVVDAVVLRRNDSGQLQVAVVGSLSPGTKTGLRWKQSKHVPLPSGLPMQMTSVMRKVVAASHIKAGEVRLLGRMETPVDGMTILPSANQTESQTVLIAHLKYTEPLVPQRDQNLLSEFRETRATIGD